MPVEDRLPFALGRWVGRPVPRLEDGPLLAGAGEFMADVPLPGALHAAFVRSPLAHAEIRAVDTRAARAVAGVADVLAAADLPHRPLEDVLPIDGLLRTPQPALAGGRVRFAGEAVALVLAASRYEAEDGAERVEVDYDELTPVLDPERAGLPGATLLHPELGTNVVYAGSRTFGDVDAAFAGATHVVRSRFEGNRYLAAPLEGRGCAARFDAAAGTLTFWSSTQSPHLLRRRLAIATGIGEARIRVLTPHVGGGFGLKIPIHPEEVAVAVASMRVGHPVVWIEDRRENLLAAPQAKDQRLECELALGPAGEFLGLRTGILGDAGAYSFNNASALIEPYLAAVLMPGVYRLPAFAYDVRAVVTNKPPVAPYRGVGWTQGHCARELLVEQAARELGLDAAELRRRNLVQPGSFPFESCTGMVYDSGSFSESLERALELVGYEQLRAEQPGERARGVHRGVAVSPYVEPTGWGTEGSRQASWVLVSHDVARVAVEPSGEVTIAVGTPSQGQGHATTLAQLAADALGTDPGAVTVHANDTAAAPMSVAGTRASRTAVVVGGAVVRASTVLRERILTIAGHLLEADPADLELGDGAVALRDAPSRRVSLREVAEAAYFRPDVRAALPEPDLAVSAFHDPGATYSNGTIAVVVEVDVQTGSVRVERAVAVEDCGTILNPLVVDGQIHGAVAQGIGGALLEHAAHDGTGQPLAVSFADYLLPTAAEVPDLLVEHTTSPSPNTPGGMKGMGESGLIATPAAVAAAVEDALAPFGARVEVLPLTPERILAMIPPT